MYLHLQNQFLSNSHCLTYYNKLLYVYMCGGGGEEYCELLVNLKIVGEGGVSWRMGIHNGLGDIRHHVSQ